MKPVLEIYQGQALLPPGEKGQNAGSALWVRKIHPTDDTKNEWCRIESTSSWTKLMRIIGAKQ
jgi:hypothetical protein